MQIELSDRVAVVTGASSGMGAETARVMGRAGAAVLAVGRDRDRLARTVADIEAAGGRARALVADLADGASAGRIVDAALELGGRIDALVLAAGHFVHTPLAETPVEQLDELWTVHVRTPFLLVQRAQPHLGEGSTITFFSSTVAQSGFAPYATYTAVKGAVEAMARSLAVELSPTTRVNVIAPGFTGTPMVLDQFEDVPELEGMIVQRTPVGFLGGPESAAHTAAFLASDLAHYIHGARIVVDGGWTAQGWQA
ncbi:MAG: SDR family oxidoreductase [Solirubrobacteraceae bacterium]|nr:SDR family oxidoreductase [Solirubrobacteraceae bacterium]